jgi:plastocyanin
MRHARLVSAALLSVILLAACTTANAGWTYAPAPSKTPIPSSSGSASAAPGGSAAANVVVISASNIKYEQTAVTAPAGTPFQIQFENKDAGVPHNVAIHLGGATGAELFKGTIFNGIETRTYDVPALDAGSYAFVCSVHPTMIGTLTVQ